MEKCSADRFIPRRAGEDFNLSNFKLLANKDVHMPKFDLDHPRYLNYAQMKYKMNNYVGNLWQAIMEKDRKVLNFTEPKRYKRCTNSSLVNKDWPVKARKKPMIGAPNIVLDIPDLNTNLCMHITEWGKSGYLASVFNKEICLWCPELSCDGFTTNTGKMVNKCIRWSTDGTRLAFSMSKKNVGILDVDVKKVTRGQCGCCYFCTITAIAWCNTNQYLLTGCTNGVLSLFTSTLMLMQVWNPTHCGPIYSIEFSSQGNYFATSGEDEIVRMWNWPIQENLEVTMYEKISSIAWHPFQESLLAVGKFEGEISFWNVSSAKLAAQKNLYSECDCLTWNEITGELVVSLYGDDDGKKGYNEILVLSNTNTVVDGIVWHQGPVPYLMWSPDRRQLATAGVDENLCIWDFLERKKQKVYENRKPFQSSNFGKCIR
ncbi:PREDICTED: protein cortex [Nicrophorus vespilloides]|uniref:Protein cortex n=1 Tax=Nicrophorus vespilloides TaxID=110193 RepID=A0ABM1MR28_NICVS|nr:PREDICTED: protein cortex [Nicrophorus vespilloides]